MGKNENGIDIFKIDLDKDAKHRFSETTVHFKKQIGVVLETFLTLVPDIVLDMIEYLGRALHWVNPEYYEEVDGIAYYLEQDIGPVMFMQYVFEFSSFCSSIIVKSKEGKILHDRNLDFPFSPVMRNVTYVAHFYKGDQYLFESTMFAGYNGILTGIKKGAYSISINGRSPSQHSSILEFVKNIAVVFAGYKQNTKLTRDIFLSCDSYDCAFEKLKESPVSATSYFAIAGLKNNEGAIISRDRFSVANIDQLSDSNWFLV